jgi:hypothetical protein
MAYDKRDRRERTRDYKERKRKKRRQNKADQATTYEERLNVGRRRRHQADMVQTFKILTGKDMVNSETWFTSVTESGRPTRSAADPLNLRPQTSRLEIRRQFFSQRVVKSCNKIPAS